jgi:hypothetical protein
MNMFPIYQWFDDTAIGQFIAGNTWAFPLTETFHIMALAVMFGCIFISSICGYWACTLAASATPDCSAN